MPRSGCFAGVKCQKAQLQQRGSRLAETFTHDLRLTARRPWTIASRITKAAASLSYSLRYVGCLQVRPVDVGEAAELVAHLTARNAHLRATFRSTVETLIAEAGSIFAGEANFRLLFGDNAVTPTPRVRELINRAIPLRPLRALTGLPEPLLSEIVFTLLRENFDKLKQNAGEPFAAEVLVQCPIVALSACLTCRRCQRIEMGPDSRTDFSIQLVVRA